MTVKGNYGWSWKCGCEGSIVVIEYDFEGNYSGHRNVAVKEMLVVIEIVVVKEVLMIIGM